MEDKINILWKGNKNMGIFIYCKLSPRVTKKEWDEVYAETLKLVEAFPFARLVQREFYGARTIYRLLW